MAANTSTGATGHRRRDLDGRRAGALRAGAIALAWAAIGCSLPLASARAFTISPLAGTPDASPSTQISFLGAPPSQISDVTVRGSRSGRHAGRLAAYASAPGASFLPSRPFTQGESVVATALVGPRGRARRVSSSFEIARSAPYGARAAAESAPHRTATRSSISSPVQSFFSQPQLSPPSIQVLLNTPQASTSDIFLTPAHGPGQHGPMILDHAGSLVWFQPAPAGEVAEDLQVERYEGRRVLVWWQGRIPGSASG